MKKLIDFGRSPWPLFILTGLTLVIAVLASLDWSHAQNHPQTPTHQLLEGPRP